MQAIYLFLTDADDRSSYIRTMSSALKPGAYAIIATFDLDGPEKCSGLDVVRYSPETLSAVLGDAFQLVESRNQHGRTCNAVWFYTKICLLPICKTVVSLLEE